MALNLYVTGGDNPPYITTNIKLTYMVVLDSVSKEETERIWDVMTDKCSSLNYLWWGNQKVGIIFSVDKPDYDALRECEKNEIHCSYVTVTDKFFNGENPDKAGASRVSVYTDDKNVVRVSTSSIIFGCYFEQ